ncbi:MAG: glycerophosphoryl diester phosphodiesterase [Candidatus Omnitrophica bacterium CG11_big_fil_rev_8_21_14_0_20_63_9]|nr:MAG: glycerophosphoryl diester phosphodiesterase [Candidatus Omnitrophica bacterium CG11_big_fil_rev_8_21_14_0_20_63_9]
MKRALLIAHRGASAVAPESTRAAIREAARAGADMIELDVQLTRDQRLIIFHDDRLERTTTGRGAVRAFTLAQIRRLDAGSWFHPRFTDQRVLSVQEAIRLVPARMRINLELKRTRTPRPLLRRLRALLKSSRVRSRLLLSSFDARLVKSLPDSGAMRALICRFRADHSLRQAITLGCASWHPFYKLVTRRRMQLAHAAGLRVYAWTVDDASQARRLIHWGVDGIFTNHPAALRHAVRRAR